jgi:predicted metalloprotease with PDZ domain
LIRDFASNVTRITATSEAGDDLHLQKISKDRWQVKTDDIETLIVDYEVFTPEISVNSSWASKLFTLINGASVFLYTKSTRHIPQTLNIDAGLERGQVFTALPSIDGGRSYLAGSYDELVDNPVAIADTPEYRFESNGQEYVLVNVGEGKFWDGEKAAADVEKLVKQTQTFWGTNPLSRPYWFLNFAVEGRGGLEHDHSTVTMASRRQMLQREDYIKWLGLVTHEFFHVWNVRHMRPANLADIDYQREQYSRQLWLAEGLSSYYDNLLLSRSKLITPKEYLELLAKDVHKLETTPGRKLQPVTEASLDAWIRHYQPNANSINSTVSYYTKGALIGFVLDAYLRKQSKGRNDLDQVMRLMYEKFSRQPYTDADFENVLEEVGGPEAVAFLKPLLETNIDPDVDEALDYFGLELNRNPVAQPESKDRGSVESGFGVIWEDDKTSAVVKAVLAGSTGAIAGILPGDEVLAIGNERVDKDNLHSLMTSFVPGETNEVLISRRGRIMTMAVKFELAAPEQFNIVVQSGFSDRHIKRLQRFLGQNLRKN